MKKLILGLITCLSTTNFAFAGTTIDLAPGSSSYIQAGDSVYVTCGDVSNTQKCNCQTDKDQFNRWGYQIRLENVLIREYYSYKSEAEAGRKCLDRIKQMRECK
ncbi:MAG: hypothetical protein CME60_10995 [Halobacteriovoraceae bacterium]|nr:hypothetical protein [Halobacteriovoraceae bacterium]|tara:strand:+ start:126290 stop:126601 length:312 start_codon:yes stop_codon:yes gene_type:complete